jgi:hypothetical protein
MSSANNSMRRNTPSAIDALLIAGYDLDLKGARAYQ